MSKCEERTRWHKLFNLASWLFLFFALFALFTDNFWAAIFAITISLGYRIVDTILNIRHIKWHLNNDEGEHTM